MARPKERRKDTQPKGCANPRSRYIQTRYCGNMCIIYCEPTYGANICKIPSLNENFGSIKLRENLQEKDMP